MKLNALKLCTLAALISGTVAPVFAEGNVNSAVRWVIDSEGVPKANLSNAFDGWHAQPLPGNQKALAITGDYQHYKFGPDGYNYREYSAFAVGEYGSVFQDSDAGWIRVNGCWGTLDISSASPEHAWCVNGDGTLKQYDQASKAFTGYIQLAGESISKIDVDKDGTVWAVTLEGNIYTYANNSWEQKFDASSAPYKPENIAVGAGNVYLISSWTNSSGIGGGKGLFSFSDGEFELISQAYYLVDVDRDNVVWVAEKHMDKVAYKRPGMKDFERHSWHVSDDALIDIGM